MYPNIPCAPDYTNISGYEEFIPSSNSGIMDDEELYLAPGQCVANTIIIIYDYCMDFNFEYCVQIKTTSI